MTTMTEGQRIAEEMDGAPRAETARRIDAALAEVGRERDECRHEANAVLEVENAALRRAVEEKEPAAKCLWPMLRVWGEECQTRKMELRAAEAALAARDREHNAALAACATTGGQWGEEILELRAKLAEREAQTAMLREELGFLMQLHGNTSAGTSCHCPRCARAMRARDDTAGAARAFVERIRDEGYREAMRQWENAPENPLDVEGIQAEERERCAAVASEHREGVPGCCESPLPRMIAAAIRALPPRRGT